MELEPDVKNRILYLQAQRERERLVSSIANRIRTSLDLGEILNCLATEVRKVLNCDRVFVYQLNLNGSGTVIAEDVTSGWLSFRGEEVSDPCFAQNWIEPYAHGRIRVVSDIYTDGMTPCHRELLEYLQIRAKILVPIIVKEKLWGLMLACQNNGPRIWQQEETELIQQLSTHVSIAIQQAELFHRLQLELQERKQTEELLRQSERKYRLLAENLQIAEAQLQQLNEELEARVEQRTLALQESQYFVQRIAEASPDILYIYDLHEKRNIYINHEIARLMGYSPQQIQDMGEELLAKIMHPDDLIKIINHFNGFITANDEEIRKIEYRMCDRFGNWHWFLSHDTVFNRDSDNLPKQIIGAASEISERKEIEAKLRQTNTELAKATQLKDQFLANMSHELRTPLNAILGMSEGLQEEVFGKLNPLQKRAITTIECSGKHLLELINDILDLSRIETGKLDLQITSVSCSSLCDSSLIFVKQQSRQKNIAISVEVAANLPEIMVDERRFRQILINLLDNAVKFTHHGGKIQLVVKQVEEKKKQEEEDNSSQWIRFIVIDNGIGIAEANLDKIFEPFVQIDSSLNRQYNGTGLGLSLVRQLVELHGGKITVTSELDHGSSFQVDIPYRGEAKIRNCILPNETHNQEATIVNHVQKKSASIIFFSDDTQANITTIFNYLEAKGYRIILAKNGKECMNITKAKNPNLILIDIPMSEIDRIETIQLLRADKQIQHIPIIVLHSLTMSSNDSDEQSYHQKCIAMGVDEYFTKPVKLRILAAKIQTLLTGVRS